MQEQDRERVRARPGAGNKGPNKSIKEQSGGMKAKLDDDGKLIWE